MRSLLLLSVMTACAAHAQHRNDNWLFGTYHGLNFAQGTPTWFPGGAIGGMCSSAISDPNGVLQFYAGYDGVFNQNHQIMTNGAGPWPANPAQGVLIVPVPGSASRYAVFFNHQFNQERAGYVEVDMSLANGLGDVVDPNIQYYIDSCGAKLTAVPHGNGDAYWIVHHEMNSNEFHAYRLSSSGLDTVPVISQAGSVHQTWWQNQYSAHHSGIMKASYRGDRLAVSSYMYSPGWVLQSGVTLLELFTFDDQTGQVSYMTAIPDMTRLNGVEFSQDGSHLYAIDEEFGAPNLTSLWQWSLDPWYEDSILNSASLIGQWAESAVYGSPHNAMALGPDGKIYFRMHYNQTTLSVVHDPNLAGLACNAVYNDLLLQGTPQVFGLPNFIKRYHDSEFETGLNEITSLQVLQAMPNPLTDMGLLRGEELHSATRLRWVDALGRVVLDERPMLLGNDIRLERRTLASGLYSLALYDNDEILGRANVVVR